MVSTCNPPLKLYFGFLNLIHLPTYLSVYNSYCFVAGVLIDVLLENWKGKYDILESRHDYIQWYTLI